MGTLYIVSTPIGNLDDITIRAIKTLFTVSTVACEDTRKTGFLLSEIQKRYIDLIQSKKPQLIAYHEHNEEQKTPELIQLLKQDKDVALVSDAGTPLVADPGFLLVQACIKSNIKIVPIPGPSAFVAAASISGLPTSNLWFLGYLPKKSGKRKNLLKSILQYNIILKCAPTVVFYEVPHRLLSALEYLQTVFGDNEIVIARELTKVHEEVWRGKISGAIEHFQNPKGEFVLLLSQRNNP